MKSKFLTAGLIAAMMIPAAAQAQTGELRRDRQEVREQKRDVRQAVRHGDRGDVREQRRDLRDARQEYREDKRDWRRDNRYANWRAPFKYHQFRAGSTLRPTYYAPSYRLNYDSRWGVPRANRNLTYVRHYNDLLLVNVRSGKVIKVYRNHFRWR
jgi:Ni/Co efflux regulator RcnB